MKYRGATNCHVHENNNDQHEWHPWWQSHQLWQWNNPHLTTECKLLHMIPTTKNAYFPKNHQATDILLRPSFRKYFQRNRCTRHSPKVRMGIQTQGRWVLMLWCLQYLTVPILITGMNAVNMHYLIVNRFVVVGKYYFRHAFPIDRNLLQ
jgi:hypothetical protein